MFTAKNEIVNKNVCQGRVQDIFLGGGGASTDKQKKRERWSSLSVWGNHLQAQKTIDI